MAQGRVHAHHLVWSHHRIILEPVKDLICFIGLAALDQKKCLIAGMARIHLNRFLQVFDALWVHLLFSIAASQEHETHG